MTQRNPMNDRTRYGKQKGVSRKSASSAKPVRQAGSSVHVVSDETKKKREKKERTAQEKEERKLNRKREAALGATILDMPKYKKWRRIWLALIIIAIVAVAASWLVSYFNTKDIAQTAVFQDFATPLSVGGLVVGYGAIIAALIIDFKVIRPMRREQEDKVRKLTKREKHELDVAIAESEAAYEAEKKDKPGFKLPWSKGKAETAQDALQTDKSKDAK